jgi:hypothetical protein
MTKHDQILTKYNNTFTKYDTNDQRHVENFQERDFLRIKTNNAKNIAGWGGGWGLGGGALGYRGGEGYGPLSRKLKFIIKSQAPVSRSFENASVLLSSSSHSEGPGPGALLMWALPI